MAKIEFREATLADAEYIGKHMRAADRAEVLALGQVPERAPAISVRWSEAAWTGLIDDKPAMVFGVGGALLAEAGSVWALGTEACSAQPRAMVKYGREWLQAMLVYYPELENWCDARYVKALRWLRAVGCEIGNPEPHGPRGELFCRLTIRKESETCV